MVIDAFSAFPSTIQTRKPILILMLKGIQFILELLETKALKSLGAKLLLSEPISGCKNYEFKSRDYWECYVRQKTESRMKCRNPFKLSL